MTRHILPLLGVLALVGCDGVPDTTMDGSVETDGSIEDMDGSVEEDMDGSIEEELVCDGGCWVRRCREVTYASGAPSEPLEVGEMRDDTYTPYTDGGQATLVFGFQGGVMIEPLVSIPEDEIGASDCVQITVRNRPDPAYPELAGELADFTETVFIDPLRTGWRTGYLSASVLDQLGWVTAPELRMILEVEARGVDWVRSTELALHVVDADGLDACDVVPRRSQFGCELAVLEGTMTVDAVGDIAAVACNDSVDVTVTLDPDIEVPAECAELTQTVAVSAGCVLQEGYTVGQTVADATWELPADSASGCDEPRLGLLTSGCPCL